ncbi:MAG: DNA repair protein RecN [Tepidiformaceae bacterium]
MLERIRIRGFAVARDVEVLPGPGLNVFTGETGAGKSLIVDALAFALGGRRGREVIGSGSDRAVVEAALALPGGRVIIERTISLSGRSSVLVDGAPATLETLRALAATAADIHGQSEHLSILRPQEQLLAIDSFAGSGHLREQAGQTVRALRSVRRDLQVLTTGVRERERLVEQLRFESSEIAGAALAAGEDDAIRAEVTRLASAGRLIEDAALALEALDQPAIAELFRAAGDITTRDASADEVATPLTMLETAVADLGRALRNYRDGLEDDPARLAHLQERLDLIARLKRKYGDTIADVIAYGEAAKERLEALERAGESAEDLQRRERELLDDLTSCGTSLSRARREAAGKLAAALAAELERLGMSGAALAVGFSCEDDPTGPAVAFPDYEVMDGCSVTPAPAPPLPRAFTESGIDRVEFLASFNPGEASRPLSAVASGGETSRFLLALTTVLGEAAAPRIIVLDEVDEGVGGRAGSLVGEALTRLAARHQVLCITHLPQVAAYGRDHFVVSKQSGGGQTSSEVNLVEGDARVRELAAMLGGANGANLAAARELLRAAPAFP